jgi:Protein of unknown function (DUF1367)
MKKKGVFVRTLGAVTPFDSRAEEIIGSIALGQKVLMYVQTARYPEHHSLAWAVFQRIGEAIGEPAEVVAAFLKKETGRFDWMRLPDGTVLPVLHSIAFESMSQEEFQKFWNDALVVIFEKLLPDIPEKGYREIMDIIEGKETPHA